jgi:hypothetical protein
LSKVGEFTHEFNQRVREVTLKTTTGCTKGDVGHWDTDGFHQATTSDKKPFVVFRETVVAPTAGQSTAVAATNGCILVNKAASGALSEGKYVKPGASGVVAAATMGSDTSDTWVGRVIKAVASGATTVEIELTP